MSIEACAAANGTGFLETTLRYLDCAGKDIGSAGYGALVQPSSPVTQLIFVAITLLIAWQGIRMMFGRMPDMGDAAMTAAKIGLVLMLATSWPAVRTLFAEPAASGPRELVAQSGIAGSRPIEERLQRVDDGIVSLTKWGTGKLDIRAGRTAGGQPAASEFSGIALADSLALGLGRLSFLVGALMSLGTLKLMGGIMIAALPLFAGLLLFDASRSLFWGWLKLMFALFIASFAVPLILTVELALIEPWLARAIEQRSQFLAAPAAPTELLAITASFTLILAASMALIARACLTVDHRAILQRTIASTRLGRSDAMADGAGLAQARDQRAELSRATSLAATIGRLDQLVKGGAGMGSPASRPTNDGARHHDLGALASRPDRQRARQRMALSHLKRNQR